MSRRFWSAVFAALSLTTSASVGTGQEFFMPREWQVELTGPGSGVQMLPKDEVAILYRGFLLSRTAWKGGTISFEWQPPDNVKGGDGHMYGDHLSVLLSTTGDIRSKRSYEPYDGVIVRLDAASGNVRILSPKKEEGDFDYIADFKGDSALSKEWHKVVIVDTLGSISVLVDGKLTVDSKTPASARKGTKFGFFNREPVGPGEKISKLRNIAWRGKE